MSGDFPVATVKRIMKNSGAERVSDRAAEHLAGRLEEIGLEISKKAVRLMYHAGRKTVTEDDIKLAASR